MYYILNIIFNILKYHDILYDRYVLHTMRRLYLVFLVSFFYKVFEIWLFTLKIFTTLNFFIY